MSLPSDTEAAPNFDTVNHALDWRKAGHGVALATVTRTWGASPCPVGSHLAIRDDNTFEGSVSGGCIEGEVVTAALKAIRGGGSETLTFGVANEEAWQAGLACGGKVSVFVSALDDNAARALDGVAAANAAHRPAALLVDTETGAHALWRDGDVSGDSVHPSAAQLGELQQRFSADRSGLLEDDGAKPLFARIYNPGLRLLIVGAVHIAQHLAEMAGRLGYDVTVIDPRDTWGTDARFPHVRLDRRWPSTALEDFQPDARTAVVTLSHDPKLDDPALLAALESDAFYIGSLGSSRTHAARVKRLTEAGVSEAKLARIHAPVGLDIGAQSPGEIALSALAQITEALRRPESGAA